MLNESSNNIFATTITPITTDRKRKTAMMGGMENANPNIYQKNKTPASSSHLLQKPKVVAVYPTQNLSVIHQRKDSATKKKKKHILANKNRWCTDLLFLVLILAAFVGSMIVGVIAIKLGDPLSLLDTRDYLNKPCVSPKNLLILDPTNSTYPGYGVCVSKCPTRKQQICNYENDYCFHTNVDYKMFLFFRCVPLPLSEEFCEYSPYLSQFYGNQSLVDLKIPATNESCGECLDGAHPPTNPAKCKMAKKTIIQKRTTQESSDVLMQQLSGLSVWSAVVFRWVNDASTKLVPIVLGGGPVALGVGYLWIGVFACFSRVAVWGTLLGTLFAFYFVSYQLFLKGQIINRTQLMNDVKSATGLDAGAIVNLDVFERTNNEVSPDIYAALGWIFLTLSVILTFVILVFRLQLHNATKILGSASKSIFSVPTLLLVPIVSFGIYVAIVVWCGVVFLYLISIQKMQTLDFTSSSNNNSNNSLGGGVTTPTNFGIFQTSGNTLPWLIVFHVFACIWFLLFVRDVSCLISSGVVCAFYYRENTNDAESPKRGRIIYTSAFRIIRYHLGSAALGSFLISVLYLLRLLFIFVSRYLCCCGKSSTSNNKNKPTANNSSCLERSKYALTFLITVLSYASKLGYTVVVLKGLSFCSSAKFAFVLLSNNLVDSVVSTYVTFFIITLGRMLIMATSSMCTWALIMFASGDDGLKETMESLIFPLLTSALLGFFVGGAVIDLYETSLNALIICKSHDAMIETMYGGKQKYNADSSDNNNEDDNNDDQTLNLV